MNLSIAIPESEGWEGVEEDMTQKADLSDLKRVFLIFDSDKMSFPSLSSVYKTYTEFNIAHIRALYYIIKSGKALENPTELRRLKNPTILKNKNNFGKFFKSDDNKKKRNRIFFFF